MISEREECVFDLNEPAEKVLLENENVPEQTVGGENPTDLEVSHSVKEESTMLGLTFKTEDDAYRYYNAYAREVGFGIRRHSSTLSKLDKKILSRVFCCANQGEHSQHSRGTPKKKRASRRTGCMAMIQIRLKNDEGYYIVVDYEETHNHELAPPSRVHLLRSHRKIQPVQKSLIDDMHSIGMGSAQIFEYFQKVAGGSQNVNFIPSDCNNYVQRKRTQILKKGDAELLFDYFRQMERKNKSFFYSIQVDDRIQICSFFWCDARSRIDYNFFGDVICFDTTFKTNGYDMPFAPIVGVNNHGQTIFFGCGLLQDETKETFTWLFQTFLEAMGGKHPKTIFTDQDAAMANAIRNVFPGTHHRLCIWHIYQNAAKHLSHVFDKFPSFSVDFKKCIYDNEAEEEFMLSWNSMLETYHLTENEWLQNLYQLREKWAQVYGRENFCAGITTTQRSESINKYLKKYFKRNSILREFVEQYEKAVTNRRDKEIQEDNNTRQTRPALLTEWKVELRASERYTRKEFNVFQREYKGIMDLDLTLMNDDGVMKTYKVSSYTGARPRTVTYISSSDTINCSCKKFEFTGVLCAHALRFFRTQNLADLPSKYYLKRWTRDAMYGVVFDSHEKPIEVDLDKSLSHRYNELSQMALTIAVKGARSMELSSIVKSGLMELINKVDCFPNSQSDQRESSPVTSNHNLIANGTGNITLRNPPRKKPTGKSTRILGVLDKSRKCKKNTQSRSKDYGGKEARIEVPHHFTTPENNVVSGSSKSHWTTSFLNGGVHPLTSSNNTTSNINIPYDQGGLSSIPFIPSMQAPVFYSQGSIMPTNYLASNTLGSNIQFNQKYVGFLSQQSSAQTSQCPTRRLDFSSTQ